MKLVSLAVSDYRQFLLLSELGFPPGITGLCGPNGVGKSKLIEAIGYALYGFSPHIFPRHDRVSDIVSWAAPNGRAPRVRLVIELGGQEYQIERSTRGASIGVQGSTTPLATGQTAVTNKVIELLGLPPTAYVGTFVARQKEVAILQALATQDRLRLVNRLIGITRVERAREIARREASSRAEILRAAEESSGETVVEATASLEKTRSDLLETEADRESAENARDEARAAWTTATSALTALQQRAEAAKAKQREGVSLNEHIQTLESTLKESRERADAARAATDELSGARTILERTGTAEELLHIYDSHANAGAMQARLSELQQDMNDRILPGLRERERLNAVLAANQDAIQRLSQEIGVHEASQEAWARAAQSEAAGLARHVHRRETALELGEAGECEACGQAFGPNLAHALEHFGREIDEAKNRELEAQGKADAEGELVAHAKASLAELHQTYQECKRECDALDTLVGQQTAIDGEIARVTREVASLLETIPSLTYDAEVHREASRDVELRRKAILDINRLEPLAQLGEAAEKLFQDSTKRLIDLQADHAKLMHEIGTILPDDEAFWSAQDDVARANERLQVCETTFTEAISKAAALRENVISAEHALNRARDRETRINVARRSHHVALRTAEVLGRLLEAINEEARPRLAELMDAWGHQLLAPTFQGVSLTPDYRITADSGSGWHAIEHFSGGEQTILSIMLRVAISLFCQERAGHEKGFLVLDEVFGDQDGQRRTALVAFLEQIREHFHQILIVNHVDDVTNMLDSIIDVTPTGPKTSLAAFRL